MKYALAAWLAALSIVANATKSPVERVVRLLEDLESKLELDGQQEQQMYDKYACWCEKTTARKADDIVTAQKQLRALGQTILSLKGRIATLTSEIAQLTAEIKAIEAAMEQATAQRQKSNGEWMAESEEIKSCLTTLQDALKVLIAGSSPEKKDTGFLQSSAKAATAVRSVIAALPSNAALKASQLEHLSAFVQAGGNMKYAPQSFTVQGILSEMYTTFAADLESATMREASQNREFENYMHLKATQKATKETQRAEKRKQKAEAEERLADTQAIYDETEAQRKADIKFFDQTHDACESKHSAWVERKTLRDEELDGVRQALAVLTTDANRDRFITHISEGKETGTGDYDTGRDITPSFLQIHSHSGESTADAAVHAYASLKDQVMKTHSLRLAALAARVKLMKAGHFEAVIQEIDVLMQTLKDEGNADIEKRDQCKDEYQSIASTIANVTWLIEKNDAKIKKLTGLIELREQQLLDTNIKINETKQYKIDITATRTAENAQFKSDKSADQDNIDALMSARDYLTSYFRNHSIDMGPIQGSVKALALAQQPEFDISADQAPDAQFSGSGKRATQSKDIVSMLTMIIEDINDEIKNDMKAEEDAQVEYEGMMKEADALLKSLGEKKTSLENAIAQRRLERTDEETDRTNNKNDLQDEIDYKASITDDCDFIIRTFSARASARTAEFEGLEAAKEYLVGATTPAPGLLQKARNSYDDEALPGARFLGLGH